MINPVFAVTLIVGLSLPLWPSKDARTERLRYWVGALIASASAFLALYPDWGGGLGLAGALAGGLVLRAYMSTPYIVIRGKTFAFSLSDSRAVGASADDDPAPDSYGGLATAQKTWWLLVVAVIACALIVWIWLSEHKGPWYAFGAATTVAIVAIGIGYQDGSWEYPIACGQVVQLTVAGVASIGIFASLYLVAYAAGGRWPLRPKGRWTTASIHTCERSFRSDPQSGFLTYPGRLSRLQSWPRFRSSAPNGRAAIIWFPRFPLFPAANIGVWPRCDRAPMLKR